MKGSPPRVRGKVLITARIISVLRITPACAGKSACARVRMMMKKDHPRVCGEKTSIYFHRFHHKGSPPRVRGKDCPQHVAGRCNRITPACAGKRVPCVFQILWGQDHPRVCGEKRSKADPDATTRGSPPRVRGKAFSCFLSAFTHRITPACAGKSPSTGWKARWGKDHPRVCGEKRF